MKDRTHAAKRKWRGAPALRVEPAWVAPIRNYVPSAILLCVVTLLIAFLVRPLEVSGGTASHVRAVAVGTLYGCVIVLAAYFIWVLGRFSEAQDAHRRDTRKLSALNEQLDKALNHIADGVIACDAEGRVTLMNRKASELTEWAEKNALGLRLRDVFLLASRSDPVERLKSDSTAPMTGLLPGRECLDTLESQNGVTFEVLYEMTPMLDEDGWMIGSMLTFRDVTELRHIEEQREALIGELSDANERLEVEIRKRERARRAALNLLQDARVAQAALKEREEHLRVLFEGIDDTVLVYNKKGTVVDCNHAACVNLEYDRAELLTCALDDILEKAEEEATAILHTKAGRRVPVDVHSSPIRYHTQDATIAVMRDITPLKRIQDELRESNDRLRESNQALEEYARVASHDLQEPLRKIESFSRILLDDYGGRLEPQGKHYLNILTGSATRMRRLIKDVLAFSEAGSEMRPMVAVDLNEILRVVRENLSERLAEKRGELVVADLPCITGDPTQMIQVFQNLVGNALKFNDKPKPRVDVHAESFPGETIVSVRDNGIGMKAWEIRYIFAPFKRLHGRDKYEGTGIGLAVCRKIIHRHKGTITVESVPGQGSVFKLTFPRLRRPTAFLEKDRESEPAKVESVQ